MMSSEKQEHQLREGEHRAVYVRVLDLRARRRLADGEHLRPYGVFRLGDRHQRTPTFPSEGLSVHTRRTSVHDQDYRELDSEDVENSGIYWQIPESSRKANFPGKEAPQVQERQGKVQGWLRREDYEDVLLEVYNTTDEDTGLPIEGFDAELLGVVRMKLPDLCADKCHTQPTGDIDIKQEGDEKTVGQVGSITPVDRTDTLQRQITDTGANNGARKRRCREDRWFCEVVHPPCCHRHSSAGRDSPVTRGIVLEARLEVIFSGCEVERSTWPAYDSFGQAVESRNARKCLSAQGLWGLRERLQRKRWTSGAGQAVWAAFQRRSRSVDSPGKVEGDTDGPEDWESELRELVWNGIPSEMREEVYMSLSGAGLNRRRSESGYYKGLICDCNGLEEKRIKVHGVAREHGSSLEYLHDGSPIKLDESFLNRENELQFRAWREIEADVDRVFMNGKTRVNSAEGMVSLRRLLRAYSLHNPAVGYCQGMNFVAGLLLEVVTEETAFWLLAMFCEDLNPEYHTKSMLGARSDIAALKEIVRDELPRFHTRASEVDMPLELKLTQWLLVGFVNCFPPSTALRVLEVSFLEGSDVYFATALAFLRVHEAEILEGRDIADVVCTLDRAQGGMYDADILLKQVWRELAMVGDEIRAARRWHRDRVVHERAVEEKNETSQCWNSEEAWHGSNERSLDDPGEWLQGRSSTESGGSAWLFLVPKSLAGQVEAILSSLSKTAPDPTRGALGDGILARSSLVPLFVGGVRWLMGWKSFES